MKALDNLWGLLILNIMEVDLTCMVCGTSFKGEEPKYCCSGRECGCMGMPIDPIVCSEECYNRLTNKKATSMEELERYKVLLLAANCIKKLGKFNGPLGLCQLVDEVFNSKVPFHKEYFPVIFRLKEEKGLNGGYWYPYGEWELRVALLEEAIEILERDLKLQVEIKPFYMGLDNPDVIIR